MVGNEQTPKLKIHKWRNKSRECKPPLLTSEQARQGATTRERETSTRRTKVKEQSVTQEEPYIKDEGDEVNTRGGKRWLSETQTEAKEKNKGDT